MQACWCCWHQNPDLRPTFLPGDIHLRFPVYVCATCESHVHRLFVKRLACPVSAVGSTYPGFPLTEAGTKPGPHND